VTVTTGAVRTLLRLAYGVEPNPLGVVVAAAGTPAEATLWELWTTTPEAHAGCHVSSFCRNPLHPGPCKGWKHHLGLVSPGALHALEKARHEKLEARRKDRVAALEKAGQKVPARLRKPVVYDPAKNPYIGPNAGPAVTPGSPNLTPDAAKKAVAAVPTASDLRKKVDNRRAALPKAPAAPAAPATPTTPHDKAAAIAVDILKHIGLDPAKAEAGRAGLAATFERDLASGDDKAIRQSAQALVMNLIKKAENDSGKKLYSGHSTVSAAAEDELVRKLKGDTGPTPVLDALMKSDTDAAHDEALKVKKAALQAKKSASASKAAATRAANNASSPNIHNPGGVTPSAPLPAGTAAHVQNAAAVAARTAPRSGLSKTHVDAYGALSKEDFDKLDPKHQQQIEADLKAAHAKFLDPKKQKSVEDIQKKLGLAGGTPAAKPAPAAPSAAPAAPKAPSVAAPAAPAAPSAADVSKQIGTVAMLGKNHAQRIDLYDSLSNDDIRALSPQQLDAMRGDVLMIAGKSTDPAVRKKAGALYDRIDNATRAAQRLATPAAPPHPASFEAHLNDLRNIRDPHKLTSAVVQLKYKANTPEKAKQLSDLRHELSKRSDLPTWAKAHILAGDDDVRDKINANPALEDAVTVATSAPAPSGEVFTTTYGFKDLLKPSEKEIDSLPKPIADAIRERRDHAAVQLTSSTNLGNPTHQEALTHLFGSQDHPDTAKFDTLGKGSQNSVQAAVRMHAENNAAIGSPHALITGSQWQTLHDKLAGAKHNSDQANALEAVQRSSGRAIDKLDKMSMLDQKDFEGLAFPHRALLLDTAEKIRDLSPDPATKMSAAQTVAVWQNQIPKYGSFVHGQAASQATWLKPFVEPDLRAIGYNSSHLTPDSFKTFTPQHRAAVLADMKEIADKGGPNVTLEDRHDLQWKHDQVTGAVNKYSSEQRRAIGMSDPGVPGSHSDKIAAYSGLTKADYDGLPKAYQDAIQNDLASIGINDPMAHDKIQSVINPNGFVPLFKPTTPAVNASPELKAAVDTLYGIHPQSNTAAHQLKTYGAMRREHFNQLNPQEQQTLLADLSYIETTSKGANKDRASKLIDRFTPPGTAPGTIPPQAIYPPSNAVVGQTRIPDPKGQIGLLVQAKDKGANGDGWLRLPNGGKGPWGQYGAAGALLRHVGPDGKERFLMVERGPGISDPGKWQFPGGAIDSKETPHQGAAREIIEELGFKSDALKDAAVHGHHESAFPGTSWKYTSIAATVPHQLVPDLSTHHARAETSDAKWMTREEIAKLDTDGKLLKPLAGGALERNVLSLFPSTATSVSRPGPRTTKVSRLRGTPSISTAPAKVTHHKPSIAKNLVSTQADQDALRNAIKGPVRQSYRGKTADERLAAIGAMQGFDRTPTVKSKREMDALLATGDYIEAWRGVRGSYSGGKTAHEINEDFRSGPAYYGLGVFGNGYYLATDKKLAEAYSDGTHGSVLRVLIPKSAAIEDHASVLAQAQKTSSSVGGFRHVHRAGMGGGTLHDEGRFAAAKGLDAIEIPASTYRRGGGNAHLVRGSAYNLVNRSIVIAQEA
jgi:8-oxo-dGTP pyrophosphatase MutT (NUDIX family)